MLTLVFAFMSLTVMSQVTDSVSVVKDTLGRYYFSWEPCSMAEFPGGQKALNDYLYNNIIYPELALHYEVEGVVKMRFVVDVDGSVKNITAEDCRINNFNTTKFCQETKARQQELKKQFALLFAKEGTRVLRKMPKWKPQTISGKAVETNYTLPIRFGLADLGT